MFWAVLHMQLCMLTIHAYASVHLCVKLSFTIHRNLLSQLQLPESLTSQQLPGLQPAVDQLGAWPPLHLWLQQQPVGEGPDPERADEGHQGAEAPPTNGAQGQGPRQHYKCTKIRTSVCQTSQRWEGVFVCIFLISWTTLQAFVPSWLFVVRYILCSLHYVIVFVPIYKHWLVYV